jgi:hypothetical protein
MMQRLDTRKLPDLTDSEIEKIAALTGNKLRFEVRRRSALGGDGQVRQVRVRTAVVVNDCYLKLDTEIETEAGTMTLGACWKSGHQKLRCQATFRESGSANGILGLHSDFAPFLFDNGTRIKYVLPPEELSRRMPAAWIGRLSNMTNEKILECWTNSLRSMDAAQQRGVRDWVHQHTGQGVQLLKDALKAATEKWDRERIQAKNEGLLSGPDAQGRVPIEYLPANLPYILPRVEAAIFTDTQNDLVLTHTQGLVTVSEKRPTTVREVIRENGAKDNDVPLGLLIGRYRQHELGLRLMASCIFLQSDKNGRLVEIAAPPKLVHTMLEVSHKRARALVGIIEHPAVKNDGTLIDGSGFDPNTGFYTRVPKDIVPDLPEKITEKMAAASYRWLCDEALADFPFASDLDRAGAVSMILTAIQRRLMTGTEGAPMFATSAPVQSSGKTALVRLM